MNSMYLGHLMGQKKQQALPFLIFAKIAKLDLTMRFTLSLLTFCVTMCLSSTSVQSQATYDALNKFLNTDFFNSYNEIRLRAEESVKDFKLLQTIKKYSPEETKIVSDSYDASAQYFNSILHSIKDDLLDKKKRKFVIKYPDDYSKQLETDLNRAASYYANTYQQAVADLTEGEILGSALLLMLPQLIEGAELAIKLIKDMLNEHLIERFRFKSWEEIR
jgi:hypothetical protein